MSEEEKTIYLKLNLADELDKAMLNTDRYKPKDGDSEEERFEKIGNEVKALVTCRAAKDMICVLIDAKDEHGCVMRDRVIKELQDSIKHYEKASKESKIAMSNLGQTIYRGLIQGLEEAIKELEESNRECRNEN